MDLDGWRAYLRTQLHTDAFEVTRLTGGVINSTVRLSLSSRPASLPPPLQALPQTAVLKHAAPHMANDPSTPMPLFRQTAEARALSHLATPPLAAALKAANVVVPSLIWHDTDANVLWMSDLGPRDTLTSYLEGTAKGDSDPAQLGAQLGRALALLHVACLNPSADLVAQFTPPIPSTVPAFLSGVARSAMEAAGHADAAALSRRIGMGMGPPPEVPLQASVWGMVDVWPGSVLLPLPPASDAAPEAPAPPLALVDWEFAGTQHPGAEVGMLLAHVAVHASVPARTARCDAFAAAFLEAYMAAVSPSLSAAISTSAIAASTASASFVREALCAYGREVVVAPTFWEAGREDADALVREGAGVLRAVGENEGEIRVDEVEKGGWARYLAPLWH